MFLDEVESFFLIRVSHQYEVSHVLWWLRNGPQAWLNVQPQQQQRPNMPALTFHKKRSAPERHWLHFPPKWNGPLDWKLALPWFFRHEGRFLVSHVFVTHVLLKLQNVHLCLPSLSGCCFILWVCADNTVHFHTDYTQRRFLNRQWFNQSRTGPELSH